jgi:hypothetical protein
MRIYDDCEPDSTCAEPHLFFLRNKPISEMNQNEYDYFEDAVFECESIDPCSLAQFQKVIRLREMDMANKLDFYREWRDKCASYREKHRPTPRQRARRITRRVMLVSVIVVVFGVALFSSFWIAGGGEK